MSNATVNLTGQWIGSYRGHYDEVTRIPQTGGQIEALRITGDGYAPAGEIACRAALHTGVGEGQITEKGFRNPRFIPGKLTVLDQNRIVFGWETCGRVEYRRDD